MPSSLMIIDDKSRANQSNYESDEVDSNNNVSDLDEGGKKNKLTLRDLAQMSKDFQFELGIEFTSIEQFKYAIREYSLLHGYDLMFLKNNNERITEKIVGVVRMNMNMKISDIISYVREKYMTDIFVWKVRNARGKKKQGQ